LLTIALANSITRHRATTSTRWHFTFAICCHSNATCAPICKSAQQCTTKGHPLPFPKLHPGLCSSVGMRPWTDTQTDRQTDACDHYISHRLRLTRNV